MREDSESGPGLILGVETSCDDSSVALMEGGQLIGQLVSSQTRIHEEYGGIVPELATRQHLNNLLPLTRELFQRTERNIREVKTVAATRGPGLPNALRIGFTFAQSLALGIGAQFEGIHHHEAHLFSSFLGGNPASFDLGYGADSPFPFISLIVSGGHTMLVHVEGIGRYRILGKTIDDAAGECYDKTAKMIGFPYPGGPHIDAMAPAGNPKAIRFPRPMIHEKGFNFSFSGLKTAVRYYLRDNPQTLESESGRADLCAGIQAAIVEILTARSVQACRKYKCRLLTAAGGVIANKGLRKNLEVHCRKHQIQFLPAQLEFATDNAAMVAALAEARILARHSSSRPDNNMHLDIRPTWSIEDADVCLSGIR